MAASAWNYLIGGKDKDGKDRVFIYRIHDEPDKEKIKMLKEYLKLLGFELKEQKGVVKAHEFNRLFRDLEGRAERDTIQTTVIRSMAKAIYSTKNIGHFGLSFEYYTHFTSPIRRYPDMLAHRILASHLNSAPITRKELSNLEKMCITASEQEAEAVQAERESIRYKQVEYMLPKIGQTFDAIISGVTEWGLYVEDAESAAEGLVRVRTIGNDFYNYSQMEYALVGQRTKKKFTLGDSVNVKLVAADLAARTLDFVLTGN